VQKRAAQSAGQGLPAQLALIFKAPLLAALSQIASAKIFPLLLDAICNQPASLLKVRQAPTGPWLHPMNLL
jgi:hypothetical protein